MAYSFKIEGNEDIQKALKGKEGEVLKKLKEDIKEGAGIVKASAKSKAPKDKYNLENAIDENELWDKNGKISISVGIQINDIFQKPDAWYARMQETGTSKMKAHPYLRPALNENKTQIYNKIENDLKEVIGDDTGTGS